MEFNSLFIIIEILAMGGIYLFGIIEGRRVERDARSSIEVESEEILLEVLRMLTGKDEYCTHGESDEGQTLGELKRRLKNRIYKHIRDTKFLTK